MKRGDVYLAIDSERKYQDQQTASSDRPDMIEDFNMGAAMQAINVLMRKADDA